MRSVAGFLRLAFITQCLVILFSPISVFGDDPPAAPSAAGPGDTRIVYFEVNGEQKALITIPPGAAAGCEQQQYNQALKNLALQQYSKELVATGQVSQTYGDEIASKSPGLQSGYILVVGVKDGVMSKQIEGAMRIEFPNEAGSLPFEETIREKMLKFDKSAVPLTTEKALAALGLPKGQAVEIKNYNGTSVGASTAGAFAVATTPADPKSGNLIGSNTTAMLVITGLDEHTTAYMARYAGTVVSLDGKNLWMIATTDRDVIVDGKVILTIKDGEVISPEKARILLGEEFSLEKLKARPTEAIRANNRLASMGFEKGDINVVLVIKPEDLKRVVAKLEKADAGGMRSAINAGSVASFEARPKLPPLEECTVAQCKTSTPAISPPATERKSGDELKKMLGDFKARRPLPKSGLARLSQSGVITLPSSKVQLGRQVGTGIAGAGSVVTVQLGGAIAGSSYQRTVFLQQSFGLLCTGFGNEFAAIPEEGYRGEYGSVLLSTRTLVPGGGTPWQTLPSRAAIDGVMRRLDESYRRTDPNARPVPQNLMMNNLSAEELRRVMLSPEMNLQCVLPKDQIVFLAGSVPTQASKEHVTTGVEFSHLDNIGWRVPIPEELREGLMTLHPDCVSSRFKDAIPNDLYGLALDRKTIDIPLSYVAEAYEIWNEWYVMDQQPITPERAFKIYLDAAKPCIDRARAEKALAESEAAFAEYERDRARTLENEKFCRDLLERRLTSAQGLILTLCDDKTGDVERELTAAITTIGRTTTMLNAMSPDGRTEVCPRDIVDSWKRGKPESGVVFLLGAEIAKVSGDDSMKITKDSRARATLRSALCNGALDKFACPAKQTPTPTPVRTPEATPTREPEPSDSDDYSTDDEDLFTDSEDPSEEVVDGILTPEPEGA